ncbi:MAG TPA: hypothetical protein VGK67_19990 [Myxococcales bacterium]|jgi:hypothetical protein
MIGRLWRAWKAWTTADAFSARALVLWAGRFVLLFAVLHLLGLREHTTVLSGTVVGKSSIVSGFLGLMYLLSYFAAILLVPPVLVAAGIAKVAERVLGKR